MLPLGQARSFWEGPPTQPLHLTASHELQLKGRGVLM